MHTGKSRNNVATEHNQKETDENNLDGATADIVYDLTRPINKNKGHTFSMNNVYNSLKLSHKTETIFILHLNREFVPDSLKRLNKIKEKFGQYEYHPKVILDHNLALGGIVLKK